MVTDDDLLLYYYRDGLDDAERARIGAALSAQPELAQRLHSLVAKLDAAAALPDVPVPAATQRRWEAALANAARSSEAETRPARPSRLFTGRWLAAAAVVAGLALLFALQLTTRAPPDRVADDGARVAVSPADASAYERGLKWHLASTERQLAGLERTSPEERARLIETIVAQNRMYALAAEQAGEPQLARVLRAFAPILESLAHGGGESSASSVAQLSFELRVMQGRLGAGADAPSNATSTTL